MTTLQKTIIAAGLALAAGTGMYALRQSSQLRDQVQTLQQEQGPLRAQIQQLEEERNRATDQLAVLRDENARLKSGQRTTELLKLRGEVGKLRQQSVADKASLPASELAKMMRDPAMKEFMRQAQMDKIRSMFTDLIKELKLTPEQSDRFLQAINDHTTKILAQLTAPGQAAAESAAADASQELGTQLQALLGDSGFARFKDHGAEIPARTTVSQLNTQLGDSPLSEDQSARLLQAVKAEPYDLTQGITGAPDKAFLVSETDFDNFLQQVALSNQRILQQAGSFLTPDQLAALETLLSNAINARKIQAAALIQKH